MTATPERLRIVIAEDAAIMRDGLTQTLTRRGHDVVAAVADAEALRQAVDTHRPDVAIIDVRMPPTHTDEGLRAAQSIHRDHPQVGVLVFSQYIEAQSATELFAGAAGGVGYLLKDRVADVSDFIDAISRVAAGGTVLDPEVVRQLLSVGRRADALAVLTPREREVLALIAQGRSNAAIADTFTISPRVVEKHVASIFAKLGLPPSHNEQPPGAGGDQVPGVLTRSLALRSAGPADDAVRGRSCLARTMSGSRGSRGSRVSGCARRRALAARCRLLICSCLISHPPLLSRWPRILTCTDTNGRRN